MPSFFPSDSLSRDVQTDHANVVLLMSLSSLFAFG